jgi:hypothetical protein
MGGPGLEPVEHVAGIDDRQATLLAQEAQQVSARQHVEIGGHLVDQEQRQAPLELEQDLHPPPLPIGHLMHAPARIDVEDLEYSLAAGRLHVRTVGKDLTHGDVLVKGEIAAQEADLARQRRVVKSRPPQDPDDLRRDHVPPGHEPEQRALADAVGAEQQTPRPCRQHEGEVPQHRRPARVSEGEPGHLDGVHAEDHRVRPRRCLVGARAKAADPRPSPLPSPAADGGRGQTIAATRTFLAHASFF